MSHSTRSGVAVAVTLTEPAEAVRLTSLHVWPCTHNQTGRPTNAVVSGAGARPISGRGNGSCSMA
ncbi:hypothetical protein [Nocardiopsis tropica]|uniref:Uncharacterized protein n=1 Tax=Nocardiopsis tropica TaxID=109330 RepID=A0ABU7KMS6_9ACTN|nr:hypothetical protein [Nocardiopsis umidischolae]MEE2050596.1 hypothetical protein [Nocardiopsis umidischolae]